MARHNPDSKKPIESYQHSDKQRANNPPIGLVTPDTDHDRGNRKTYAYDPHLDPQLDWAGKAEHTSFEVPTRSLHVHERIDPRTIIEAIKKRNGNGNPQQALLFDTPAENPPLREAIAFYRHAHNWSNRLIAGDSLLVMNSLLEKEGLGGNVQTVYIDPPYGIKYGSNFQPFVNQRDVTDGKDTDLTAEPEQIRAFRDTWELGIHSYLSYLRDRLLLARALLTDSGSVFVQISDQNVHLVRNLMDEVFGVENFVRLITFAKTGSMVSNQLGRTSDYLVWFAKDKEHLKYRQLFNEKLPDAFYSNVDLGNGSARKSTRAESLDTSLLPENAKIFRLVSLESAGPPKEDTPFEYEGEIFRPNKNSHWKLSYPDGMNALKKTGRIVKDGNKLRWKYYIDDYPLKVLSEVWNDTAGFNLDQRYVVETRPKVVERCLLMTTDPGDLVFDPTCGSGTTAVVAERWGRRWIACDTSRVALTLARQRLMTAVFDYYQLAHPNEGVGSGFNYKTVPHITLKSIANNPDIKAGMTQTQINAAIAQHAQQEILYDQPLVDKKKKRVSGPFTMEAVPAPTVASIDDILNPQPVADTSIARSGETLRQREWRDALQRDGIRGKAGQHIRFARLEPLSGCRYLHADGETRPNDEGADSVREATPLYDPQRIVVSFGLEHAPLERCQVENAWKEARLLLPKPALLVFAAFQFDPEAAKDIDELQPQQTQMRFLKAQMNADLQTHDLKKKHTKNDSFWLIGQPDVQLQPITDGEATGQWRVIVHGFDYYNIKDNEIESGGAEQIALWLLDPDYDGRSLYPRQVFFPQANDKQGWAPLAKSLKTELDQDLIEIYRGTQSLPFEPGEHQRIAIKIVDNRGIESLKVMEIK